MKYQKNTLHIKYFSNQLDFFKESLTRKVIKKYFSIIFLYMVESTFNSFSTKKILLKITSDIVPNTLQEKKFESQLKIYFAPKCNLIRLYLYLYINNS